LERADGLEEAAHGCGGGEGGRSGGGTAEGLSEGYFGEMRRCEDEDAEKEEAAFGPISDQRLLSIA